MMLFFLWLSRLFELFNIAIMLQWHISYYLVKCIVIDLIAYWCHRGLNSISSGSCLSLKLLGSVRVVTEEGDLLPACVGCISLSGSVVGKRTLMGHDQSLDIECLLHWNSKTAHTNCHQWQKGSKGKCPPYGASWLTDCFIGMLWTFLQKDSSSFCLPVPGFQLPQHQAMWVSQVSCERKYRTSGWKSWGRIPNPLRSWTKEF